MGEFIKAFYRTSQFEGEYSCDPEDAGGETYRGISRVYHPMWQGWTIIDYQKTRPDFPKMTSVVMAALAKDVEEFYKAHYWDVNRLDVLPQEIAEEIFDTGVNMGYKRAAMFFQKALNCLNRNGSLFPDLVEDGVIGKKTLGALSKLPEGDHAVLVKIMNVLQGMHYIEYMVQSPTQEKFARGWFGRVEMTKV